MSCTASPRVALLQAASACTSAVTGEGGKAVQLSDSGASGIQAALALPTQTVAAQAQPSRRSVEERFMAPPARFTPAYMLPSLPPRPRLAQPPHVRNPRNRGGFRGPVRTSQNLPPCRGCDLRPGPMSRHPLALLSSLYAAQGLPFGFFTLALPVLMREAGWSLTAIGLLQLLALPWLLKFLWAPWVDHHGTRRTWLLGLQGCSVLAALTLALLDLGA